MAPLVSVTSESFAHFWAVGEDDVPDEVLSAGAQAVVAIRPTTASTDTRHETLRMGGIIAHRAITRQRSAHSDRFARSYSERPAKRVGARRATAGPACGPALTVAPAPAASTTGATCNSARYAWGSRPRRGERRVVLARSGGSVGHCTSSSGL